MEIKYSSTISEKTKKEVLLNGLASEKESKDEALNILMAHTRQEYRPTIENWFKENDSHVLESTHPILKEIVGLYQVQHCYIPQWFNSFRQSLIEFIAEALGEHNPTINEEVMSFEGDDATLSKEAKKVVDFIRALNRVTVEGYADGKLPNGQKIIKSAISAIEVGTKRKDLNLEKTSWYTTYEKNKVDSGMKNIMISDTLISKLGISSLLTNGSSCQALTKNIGLSDHNGAIYNFVNDPYSVAMYEFDVSDTKRTLVSRELMTYRWRTIIRLVEINTRDYISHDGNIHPQGSLATIGAKIITKNETMYSGYALAIDAFYPSAKDIKQAFTIVKELADKIGIPVVMAERAHYTQSGSCVKVDLIRDETKFAGTYGLARRLTLTCNKDCSNMIKVKQCDNCSVPSKLICDMCKENKETKHFHVLENKKCGNCAYSRQCSHTNCDDCHFRACSTITRFRAHYIDQLGGKSSYVPNKNTKDGELVDFFYILNDVIMR